MNETPYNFPLKERWCFLNDEAGHWYLIPVKKKLIFEKMLSDENDEDGEKFNDKFSENILNMHISNYGFLEPKEI